MQGAGAGVAGGGAGDCVGSGGTAAGGAGTAAAPAADPAGSGSGLPCKLPRRRVARLGERASALAITGSNGASSGRCALGTGADPCRRAITLGTRSACGKGSAPVRVS